MRVKHGIDLQILIGNRFHVELPILSPYRIYSIVSRGL